MWLFLNEPKISNQTRTFITSCEICCLEKNDNHLQCILSALHNFNSSNVSNFNCYIKNTFNELKQNRYIIDQDNHLKKMQNPRVNIKCPINNLQHKTTDETENELIIRTSDICLSISHG